MMPRVAEEIAHFHVPMPLWVCGLQSPERWLFAARTQVDHTLVLGGVGGPLAHLSLDIPSAMFSLLDSLWLHSTANAVALIPVRDNEHWVVWSDWLSWPVYVGDEKPPSNITLVSGFAPAHGEAGFELRIRAAGDAADQLLAGSLASLKRGLVDALAPRGFQRAARPAAPSMLCRLPRELPDVQRSAYADVCSRLMRFLASNRNNKFMNPMSAGDQRAAVGIARDVAAASADSDIAQLCWLVAAVYAHKAGGLARDQRRAALAAIRDATAVDDPVHRLAPAILHGLGEVTAARSEARAALAALGDVATDPYRGGADAAISEYRAWLLRVLELP
jgi:hypothetical protein